MSNFLFEPDSMWIKTRDSNPAAFEIFNRHYSKKSYADGRRQKKFVGPGENIVLISKDGKALFVWRKFKDDSGQSGINCAVFRNERSNFKPSELIKEAEVIAVKRWGRVRAYTYINAAKIKSRNPGYCFKVAGWKHCGITKVNKLLILEKQL